MFHSWKLPALAMAAVLGYVGFFCPACGGGGAETPVSASAASLETVEFDVHEMTCAGCAKANEFALKRLDGAISQPSHG